MSQCKYQITWDAVATQCASQNCPDSEYCALHRGKLEEVEGLIDAVVTEINRKGGSEKG